ncbi:MAG: tetratricopeptide repeat protein, partial [Candidatus Binatia bacterium]
PSQLRNWIPAVVVVMTFLVFHPVLKNGFVDWDSATLVDNSSYRGLGLRELQWLIATFQFGQYQPLLWLTFALDYILWWMDPFGYHWTSLLLHIGSAVVFYHVAWRLISLARACAAPGRALSAAMAAGVAALVFAVHPLRVEPVAWASGRAQILSALFGLLSVFCYLRANDCAESVRPSRHWMRLSICAYVCSLLAGPVGVMLPIVFLILDTYPLRRSTGLSSAFPSDARRLYWEKTPYFLAAIAFCGVSLIARIDEPTVALSYGAGIVEWTLHQLAAPAFYLWKAILPVALSPAYELRGWSLAVGVLASALICIGAIAIRKSWPALAVAWFCYLVLLLPVLRAEFPAQQILADRYTYLAGLPWALLAGIAVLRSFHVGKACGRLQVTLGTGIAATTLIALGVLTWVQVATWQDAETLWKKAVAASPSSRAYFNLATVSEAQGKYDDAAVFYSRVAEIDTQRWDAHEKAGLLLQQRGKISEAVEHYRVVVQFNPRAVEARNNLAAGLVNLGHIGEAVQHFRKLLELAPERNETRVKLGTILAVHGRAGEATEILMAAAKADPNDGNIFLRLGQVLAAQGKLPEAVHYFREATRLRTEDAETHENLGRALLDLGKKDEAARHLREALRLLRSTPAAR